MRTETADQASKLRSDIKARFDDLVATKQLAINRPGGNNLDDILLRHIPIGTDFGRAENLLRVAGFTVSSRPGPSAMGDRSDRYDVDATSKDIVQMSSFWIGAEVIVQLRPVSPADYSRVARVYGFINVVAL